VNVRVNVPWSTSLGANRATVAFTILVSSSMTESGKSVHSECGGPPLQRSDTRPLNPLTEVSLTV
jgi:hypothetical protein